MIRDYVIKHSKVVFPVIVCAAAAVTVSVALSAGNKDKVKGPADTLTTDTVETTQEPVSQEVPLTENSDPAVSTLMLTYYNAAATGDMETLVSLCDVMDDKDYYHYQEYAKYIDYYPTLQIYTKPGPEPGSTIAYVYYKAVFENHEEEFPGYQAYYICTGEDGNLYVKRGDNSDEVNEYIKQVSTQADVIEFNNRITVEYNELLLEKPELFEYLSELDAQVKVDVGEQLAKKNAESAAAESEAAAAETTPAEDNAGGENNTQPEQQEPVTQYVKATTTVNVRSSDSENADRLGKVSAGTQLELLEQRVNGWSKVVFEGKEGYIKSEYLELVESAAGAETIGTVTATTNVNVRASASETADILGVLAGGDTADLIAEENGWCKIKYNGKIGYVKANYVE